MSRSPDVAHNPSVSRSKQFLELCLAKLSVLKVIPNSVTAQYKGKAANFQQIGKTLGGGNRNLGSSWFAHLWDQVDELRYAIDLDPNYRFDYCFLGRAYEAKGQYDKAIETFQRGLKLEGNIELWDGLGHAYAASGNKAEPEKC